MRVWPGLGLRAQLKGCRKAKGIDAHRASVTPSTGVTAARAKVIVVARDPAMGRSLEVVLLAAGYDARFRPQPSADGLEELLGDARLLLVAPGLSAGSLNTLADVALSPATKIPILELLPVNGEEAVGIRGAEAVPWPCPMEQLQRRIQAALLAQS